MIIIIWKNNQVLKVIKALSLRKRVQTKVKFINN